MTVRQNVLFGAEERRDWYEQVVGACALLDDFAQLMDGEDTMIGENGINLVQEKHDLAKKVNLVTLCPFAVWRTEAKGGYRQSGLQVINLSFSKAS